MRRKIQDLTMDLTEKIIKLLMVSLERFMVKFEQVFRGDVVIEALGNP